MHPNSTPFPKTETTTEARLTRKARRDRRRALARAWLVSAFELADDDALAVAMRYGHGRTAAAHVLTEVA